MYKNYKYKIIIVSVIQIMFLFSQYALAQSDKKANIALITDKTSGVDKSSLVSLLEVELSQSEDIKLLERTAIDKIIQEQQLSAAGLLDRNTTIKIGKLLRADAFIILSLESQSQKTGDLIRVRVTETAHGLRLLDFFEQSDGNSVESIVQELESVLKKINQPDEKLIPVGIVDIHRVQLGEQYKMLERTLPTLLSSRLSLEPQIVMLEREDLKVLLDEKLMTEGEDSEFWSSAILIDGYIQPNNGQLEMHLNLKQSSGDNLKSFVVQVEPNEPSQAISQAATNIILQLQNSPPVTQWDPKQEAEQFYKQGQMLSVHSRLKEALPIFETAHALQPKNVYYIGALFVTERISRQINTVGSTKVIDGKRVPFNSYMGDWKPYYTDIEWAEILSIFVRQIHYEFEKGHLSESDIVKTQWSKYLIPGSGPLISQYLRNYESVKTQEIRMLNRKTRKIWVDTMTKALKQKQLQRTNDPKMSLQRQIAELAWLTTDDPGELINNVKQSFAELIMPPESGGIIQSDLTRDSVCGALFCVRGGLPTSMAQPYPALIEISHLKGSYEYFTKLWLEYLEELSIYKDPIISEIAKEAIANISIDGKSPLQSVAISNAYKKVQGLIKDYKRNGHTQNAQTKKRQLNQIMSYVKSDNIHLSERITSLKEIYNFLIEQNDIENLIAMDLYIKPFQPYNTGDRIDEQESYQQYYLLLEQVVEAIQTHKNRRNAITTLTKLKDYQANIKMLYPQLNTPVKISNNIPIRMILTQKDWLQSVGFNFHNGIKSTLYQDKILWITFKKEIDGLNKVKVALAGIDLEKKVTIARWQTEVYCALDIPRFDGLLINENNSYLYVEGVGIIEFPGSRAKGYEYLSDPRIYSMDDGLPSLLITSITTDGERLWVAYGSKNDESGLGIYDLKTRKWETVFCSSLKDDNPFSEGQPYQIKSMMYIRPNILFFSVSGIKQSGLWKLDTTSRKLKHIWSGATEIHRDIDNNIWLNATGYKMKFDANSEKITTFIRPGMHQFYEYVLKDISGLKENLFLPESVLNNVKFGPFYTPGNLDLSTGTIHNNKLWARVGESQVVIAERGSNPDKVQTIDNDILNGEPVYKFVSTPYGLVGIGEGVVGLIETED